jgi:two-component system, NtrC family, sensor kinase
MIKCIKSSFHLLLLFQYLLLPTFLFANDPIVLYNFKTEHKVSKYSKYYFDQSNELGLKDILEDKTLEWKDNKNPESLSLGFNTSNLWLSFDVINICCENKNWYIELGYPPLDSITYYHITEDGKITSLQDGDLSPVPNNSIKSKYYNFLMELPNNGKSKIIFKIKSESSLAIPLSIYSAEGFAEKIQLEEYFFGAFCGIMIIMAFYNLFIYFSTRENSYLFYILYILTFLLQSLSLRGYIREYFPSLLYLNNIAPILFTELSLFFGLSFTSSFLQTKENLPSTHKLLMSYMAIPFIGLSLMFFTNYSIAIKFATVTTFISSFLILFISITSIRKKYRPARFFILGWGMLSLGIVIYALRMGGIIPHNFFTNSSYQIFSILEILLLSLALGDKINILKREFSQNLEEKVNERTRELSAMVDLVSEQKTAVEQTLKELKETQAQLVEAEKKAALGQLVSSVAHEINNPISAIQANVGIAESALTPIFSDFLLFIRTLSEVQLNAFKELVQLSISSQSYISTREERNLKKKLDLEFQKVTPKNEENFYEIKEYLLELSLFDQYQKYSGIFTEKEFLDVLRNLLILISEFRALKNINISVEKTSKVIFILRKYLNTYIKGEYKTIDLSEEINKVLILYDNYILNSIQINKQYNDNINIKCISDDLKHVWRNIIYNSIQAMQSTEKVLTISIDKYTKDNKFFAKVQIEDSGLGIDPENRDKVFSPFFTTKPHGEGIGLGLYISKTIIDEHNGQIEFESERGKTTFTILIPFQHQS